MPSLWSSREAPDTALTRECGLCEPWEDEGGGGIGEGNSLLPLELEFEACELPWAPSASGRRKTLLPLSLFLRSLMGLLDMLLGCQKNCSDHRTVSTRLSPKYCRVSIRRKLSFESSGLLGRVYDVVEGRAYAGAK
jgi:hypothetical protein